MTDPTDVPSDSEEEAFFETLAHVREPREPGFQERLERAIDRREIASHVGHLSLSGFLRVLLEYAAAVFGLFSADDPDSNEGGNDAGPTQ